MEEEAAKLINANHTITSPALVKTLKATAGVEISERTANRVRSDLLGKGQNATTAHYQLLDSYLSSIGRGNGNIVECEVRTTCMFWLYIALVIVCKSCLCRADSMSL